MFVMCNDRGGDVTQPPDHGHDLTPRAVPPVRPGPADGHVLYVRPSGSRPAHAGRVQFHTPMARSSRFCVSSRSRRVVTR